MEKSPEVLKIRYRVNACPDWREATIPAEDILFDPANPEDERRACVTLIGSLLDSDEESFGSGCFRDEKGKKNYVEARVAITPGTDWESYFDGLLSGKPVRIERAWEAVPDHGHIDRDDVRMAVFDIAMRVTDGKGRPVKREDLFSRPEKGPDKGVGGWERIK